MNAAMFDGEISLLPSYGQAQLGVVGTPTSITMINQLEITWKPELIRDLNPAPLFDMTRMFSNTEARWLQDGIGSVQRSVP